MSSCPSSRQTSLLEHIDDLANILDIDKIIAELCNKNLDFRVILAQVISQKDNISRSRTLIQLVAQDEALIQTFVDVLLDLRHYEVIQLIDPDIDIAAHYPSMSQEAGEQLDQPVVQPARMKMSGPKFYPMQKHPRGHCIIVNNRNFHSRQTGTRYGSEHDVKRLTDLFEGLHFEVTVQTDVLGQGERGILNYLQDFRNKNKNEFENHDALVISIMSHGDLNVIEGSDNYEVSIQEIIHLFNNDGCPSLKDKPKIFVFVTCRGLERDGPATQVPEWSIDPSSFLSVEEQSLMGGQALRKDKPRLVEDIIIAYSTIPGYVNHRSVEDGTAYIKSLVKIFAEHAADMHLVDLLEEVNVDMQSFISMDGCKQTPTFESMLMKKLYFNPGH